MKTMFVEAKSSKSILPVAREALKSMKEYERIGLVSTVQFVNQLDKVKKLIEDKGKKAKIGAPGKHCVYKGQLLGCDAGSAAALKGVDAILYFGTGEFHPIGIYIKTEKPVFKANPFIKKVTKVNDAARRKYLAKQAARVYKVNHAKTLGILITTKPGQQQLKAAEEVKKKLEKKGKKAYLFLADSIDPNQLMNFPKIQAWINTACPRMVEDQSVFNKPLANWDELDL